MGSYEFITVLPYIVMDFVSANKIHRCTGVSRPGESMHTSDCFLTMMSIRKRKPQKKRFNGH